MMLKNQQKRERSERKEISGLRFILTSWSQSIALTSVLAERIYSRLMLERSRAQPAIRSAFRDYYERASLFVRFSLIIRSWQSLCAVYRLGVCCICVWLCVRRLRVWLCARLQPLHSFDERLFTRSSLSFSLCKRYALATIFALNLS